LYDLADLLRTRRAELGITSQERAAVDLGTTRNTYAAWETGRAVPSGRWVEPLSEWLDRPRWQVLAAIGLLDARAIEVLHEQLGGYLTFALVAPRVAQLASG